MLKSTFHYQTFFLIFFVIKYFNVTNHGCGQDCLVVKQVLSTKVEKTQEHKLESKSVHLFFHWDSNTLSPMFANVLTIIEQVMSNLLQPNMFAFDSECCLNHAITSTRPNWTICNTNFPLQYQLLAENIHDHSDLHKAVQFVTGCCTK